MRILLVEDDPLLAQGLLKSLRYEGLSVDHVATVADAKKLAILPDYELIILDLGLPDGDGLSVVNLVKKQKRTVPIVILTAKDSINDRVKGLDSGADDYLVKPFDMQELLARIRVIERRLGTVQTSVIVNGLVALDTTAHTLTVETTETLLARKEFMVLKAIMENAGRILSREQIETKLYDWGEEVASNAVEVHISNLRKKLPRDFIKTIRGVGYTVKKYVD